MDEQVLSGIIGAHGRMIPNQMVVIPKNIELLTMGSKGKSICWGGTDLTKKLTKYLGSDQARKELFRVRGEPMINLFASLNVNMTYYTGGSIMPDLTLDFEIFWPANKKFPPWSLNKSDRKYIFGFGGIITKNFRESSIIQQIPTSWFNKIDNASNPTQLKNLKKELIENFVLKHHNYNIISKEAILKTINQGFSFKLSQILRIISNSLEPNQIGKFLLSICRKGITTSDFDQPCGSLIDETDQLKLIRQLSSSDTYQEFDGRLIEILENSENLQFEINPKTLFRIRNITELNEYFKDLVNNFINQRANLIYKKCIILKEAISIEEFCFVTQIYENFIYDERVINDRIVKNLVSNSGFKLVCLIPKLLRIQASIVLKEEETINFIRQMVQSNMKEETSAFFQENTSKLVFVPSKKLKVNLDKINAFFPLVELSTQTHSGKYYVLEAIKNFIANRTFNDFNIISYFVLFLKKRIINKFLWNSIKTELLSNLSGGGYYYKYLKYKQKYLDNKLKNLP